MSWLVAVCSVLGNASFISEVMERLERNALSATVVLRFLGDLDLARSWSGSLEEKQMCCELSCFRAVVPPRRESGPPMMKASSLTVTSSQVGCDDGQWH